MKLSDRTLVLPASLTAETNKLKTENVKVHEASNECEWHTRRQKNTQILRKRLRQLSNLLNPALCFLIIKQVTLQNYCLWTIVLGK